MKSKIEISVIIPVTEKNRHDKIQDLHRAYKQGLCSTGKTFEFIYVVDGEFPQDLEEIQELKKNGENIKLIKLAKQFGESIAITIGFEYAVGDVVLTLPAYHQIEEDEIPRIIGALDGCDMVIAWRWPRIDNFINRVQSRVFHRIVKFMTGFQFHDLGCGVRAMRKKILEEVTIYGDQHRFLPLLVHRFGFKVREVQVKQSQKEAFQRVYSVGIYVRRLLDLLSVFFLIKFTKKPLRFFGLSGLFIFFLGVILGLYLFIQRVFLNVPLADRPIVLVSLLLIVLGIQIFAIGLIGEIVIFTHAKDLKEYTIEQIIN